MQGLDTVGVEQNYTSKKILVPTIAKYPYTKYLGKALSGDPCMAVDI